jgi:hypothetical protein
VAGEISQSAQVDGADVLRAKMSPRRSEALHEVGDRQHLGPVFLVGFQCDNLGGECLLVV